jgi:hypothetical protein
MKKLILPFTLIFLLQSCTIKYAQYTFDKTPQTQDTTNCKFSIDISGKFLSILIDNKTPHPITIPLHQSVIKTNVISQTNLVTRDTRYMDIARDNTITVLPNDLSIIMTIPKTNVKWIGTQFTVQDILPSQTVAGPTEMARIAKEQIGQEIKVLIPYTINGTNYQFIQNLTVKDFTIK